MGRKNGGILFRNFLRWHFYLWILKIWNGNTVKPLYSGHLNYPIYTVFETDGSLMQVESNAESSDRRFLHYFRSTLSYHLSLETSMFLHWVVVIERFYCSIFRLWHHCYILSLINIVSKTKYCLISKVLKTLWEIEHLLLRSKCSISHNLFKCQLQ